MEKIKEEEVKVSELEQKIMDIFCKKPFSFTNKNLIPKIRNIIAIFEANKSDAEKKLEKVKEYCERNISYAQLQIDAEKDRVVMYYTTCKDESTEILSILTATKLEGEK